MTLLEVSILGHWIDSAHAAADFGFHCDRFLAIQDGAGMATSFLGERAMDAGLAHVLELDRCERSRLIALLERGHEVFDRGTERMRSGVTFV